MDNRGFPAGAPIADGKAAFPYQAMNGGYHGMCYPGPEMVMPYGQYGGNTEAPFNEQCAVAQQVAQTPANMSYGFGSQAHQYMQHYRQQAHIMQAYSNAQQQNRVTNPQHIADSIYNMAAHAYNYQQHQTPQLPQAQNSYSPGSGGHNILSVRTGQSPANSIHSPAGSTHSLGDRPMLSPHVQSNAQIYNYHQANQQGATRHQSAQPQQHVSNMNYYNSNNSHTTPAINGCMSSELEHRRSIERLAAISNSSEQFNHNQEVSSPIRTNKVGQYFQPSVTVTNSSTMSGSMMPAPSNACQHSAATPSHNEHDLSSNKLVTEVVSPSSASNQPVSQSKPSSTSSSGDFETLPRSSLAELSSALPKEHSSSVLQELESLDDEAKPKETAADSGIDSEQIDKDNDEEHDTSTTSNKSENSPHPPKASDLASEDCLLSDINEKAGMDASDLHSEASPVGADKGLALFSEEAYQLVSSSPDVTQKGSVQPIIEQASTACGLEPFSPLQVPSALQPNSLEASSATRDDLTASSSNNNDYSDSGKMEESDMKLHDDLLQQSDLNESFSSQMSSSYSSNGCSGQLLGDESRLPPRKRKHKLSEHTKSLRALMPLKKRGRPSKEAIRLREAAKLAESQQFPETAEPADLGAILPQSFKERKSSVSSGSKIKKPVHSGSLLHSPKLNLIAKDDHNLSSSPIGQPMDCSDTDANFAVQSGNKHGLPLPLKSNAVLVSPPRKPKASVNEMEKALMRVVSSDVTGEILFTGKKKRGRPPGSKNRKTRLLDQRARSNSVGSSGKGQCSEQGPKLLECSKESSKNSAKSNASNTVSKSTLSQSHKLSLSVQNRTKSLHHRKTESLSPKGGSTAIELKLPVSTDQWVCTFCQHISNYRDMGDLFGGYNIQPACPVVAKVSHKKTLDSRQQQFDKTSRPNEIWFHERCIVWSPGVYMLAGKLFGVYEAVIAALQTTCSSCKKKGAILGCFCKGCSQRYHVHCAEQAECVLNEENFSMLCTKHKDRKIVLM
ncbi:transcription factor 20-like [Watersipora subatra]|uniref:transcription factor 20-like n=1 Tax=Watersipora subatra TaxID=2589382 RepID=UPI00355BAE41